MSKTDSRQAASWTAREHDVVVLPIDQLVSRCSGMKGIYRLLLFHLDR
jgi:hypothetical protein